MRRSWRSDRSEVCWVGSIRRQTISIEVAWAVERELALSLDDILARRLRLAIETRSMVQSIAARTAAIVGPALGWDDARQAHEVAAYTQSSAAEYGVP